MKRTILTILSVCFIAASLAVIPISASSVFESAPPTVVSSAVKISSLKAIAAIPPLDVGNGNDYAGGGGGGGNFGGGDNWGGGNNSGGVFFSDGDSSPMTIVFALIIVGAVIFFVLIKNKNISKGTYGMNKNIPTVINNNDKIEVSIKSIDPNFSKDKFIGWSKEVFLTLQTAWTERDWSKIRPFEKEELFKQHELQLDEYKRLGRINILERITINQAYLNLYKRTSDYEFLTVYMQVRMGDYIIDENTKAVIKGDPKQEYQLSYLMSFMRKKGVLTIETSNKSTTSCPNCGAPTTVTSAGKCEYCDSIITTGEFDWVLYNYQNVKPGMAIDNKGVDISE